MSAVCHPVEIAGPLGVLRGIFHRPAGDEPAPAIVLLHGFTGHHIEDHKLFVQMARCLADAGFAALRVSFYGSGDSDGTFEDFTIHTEVDDAAAMLDWLDRQPGIDAGRTGVLGLSLGGAVAALLAGRDPRVRAVVFWNAASLPRQHFNEIPQKGIHSGIIGGLQVGEQFVASFQDVNITGALEHYQGPGLVIQATNDEAVSVHEAEALQQALGDRGTLHLVLGADHTFRHPSWRREVFETTISWLAERLLPR